jgi:photosystem II stability/assembly factor-like uncharacterized protein
MKHIVTFILSFVLLSQVSQAQNTQTNPDTNGNPPATQSLGWVQENSGTTQQLADLSFPCKDTVFVFAGGGVGPLRSVNGGSTWQPLQVPINGFFGFYSSRIGQIANYNDGICYYTTDGGQNWLPSNDSNQLVTIVVPVTRDTAFIIGDYISRTTNGGKSWTLTPKRPNFNRFQSAAFFDSKHGICVGNTQPGPLPAHHELTAGCFTTANGGETWEQQYVGSPLGLEGSTFVGRDVVVACGVLGVVYRSSDRGITWVRVDSGSTHALYGMSSHGVTILAAGEMGVIRASSDGGASWYTQHSGITSDLSDVRMFDDLVALACGDVGVILKTTNGGTDWVQISPPSSQSISVLSFQDPETPNVEIVYDLPQPQNVTAIVYNLMGKQIATLANGELQQPGKQRLKFHGNAVPSGTYLYTITTNRFHTSGKFEITH